MFVSNNSWVIVLFVSLILTLDKCILEFITIIYYSITQSFVCVFVLSFSLLYTLCIYGWVGAL